LTFNARLFYGFQTVNDTAGHDRTFWSAAATFIPVPTGISVSDVTAGSARVHLPVAALDLAMYPFQIKVLWPGESAVAAARVEPGAQVPGKRR